MSGDRFERQFAGKVAERDGQRERMAAAAKRGRDVVSGNGKSRRNGRIRALFIEHRRDLGPSFDGSAKERTFRLGTRDCLSPFGAAGCRLHDTIHEPNSTNGETVMLPVGYWADEHAGRL